MKILIVLTVAVLSVTALVLLYLHIKTLKPIRSLLLHALLGIGVFIAVNLLSGFTGVKIPVNVYNLTAAGTLGAPAVFGLLILNLII